MYFGGDRSLVSAALNAVVGSGFVVSGGNSDDEPFVVFHDARPLGTSADQLEAWQRRLAVLLAPGDVELRPGEEDELRAVLRGPELAEVHAGAARALRTRALLTHDDLAILLAPSTLSRLETTRELGSPRTELSYTLEYAFETGYPAAASVVAGLAREGRADAEILRAWGGADAVRAAAENTFATGRDASTYFDLVAMRGEDPVAAAVALAERRREAALVPPLTEDIVWAIEELFATPHEPRGASSLAAVRDDRLPAWMRARIADVLTRGPRTPDENRAQLANGYGWAAEVTEAWPGAVDEARRDAGLPPSPGFDVSSTFAHKSVIENREYMLRVHLDGMRAALRDAALNEPSAAVLLEIVHTAGALTSDELDVLLRDWRKRLFVRPDTYTPAPPAVVTLAIAALEAGLPEGATITSALRGDKRKWTQKHRLAVIGARDSDTETEALLFQQEEQMVGGDRGSLHIRHALVRVSARRRGIDPIQCAAELLLAAPAHPAYLARDYAAIMIALAEPGSALWAHSFRDRSTNALKAALSVADDDSLPIQARQVVLDLAQETRVLTDPKRAASLPHPVDITRLQNDLTRIQHKLHSTGPDRIEQRRRWWRRR